MNASSQNPQRSPNAQKYRDALEAAIEAARGEYLTDDTRTPEDTAYNRGVSDAIAAIGALLEGGAPQPPTPRPVDPNSKAAQLAALLARWQPDYATHVIDAGTLSVTLPPASVGDWERWLQFFRVPAGTTTHRGSYSTAKGSYGSEITVLLTGHGVPALYAAQAAGGAR